MRKLCYISIIAVLSITACKNGEKQEESTTTAKETTPALPPTSKLGDANTQKITALVNVYYELKDAMVASDTAKANEAARKIETTVSETIAALKTDSANYPAMQPYFDTLMNSNKQVLAVKDKGVEGQRVHFEKISDAMYGILKTSGMKNANIYREYCPMAFNDKGAFWLSNDAEIKNPYFGKKMLECGEVTDSLK